MLKIKGNLRGDLLALYKDKGIALEGNILKLIDCGSDEELSNYIKEVSDRDREIRKKRLDITKQIQAQNIELKELAEKNEEHKKQLELALKEAEEAKKKVEIAKKEVEQDLNVLQQKTQNQLVESIVKVSLAIIVGIAITVTIMFFVKEDNQIVESAWSNMFGILLTNSFSIIGTIMGVKYASGGKGMVPTQTCKYKPK